MLSEKRYCLESKRTEGRTRTLQALRAFHSTASTIVKASERKGDKINTLVPEMGREQTPLCDLCLESWDAQSGASQICHGAEADYTEVIPVHAKL